MCAESSERIGSRLLLRNDLECVCQAGHPSPHHRPLGPNPGIKIGTDMRLPLSGSSRGSSGVLSAATVPLAGSALILLVLTGTAFGGQAIPPRRPVCRAWAARGARPQLGRIDPTRLHYRRGVSSGQRMFGQSTVPLRFAWAGRPRTPGLGSSRILGRADTARHTPVIPESARNLCTSDQRLQLLDCVVPVDA